MTTAIAARKKTGDLSAAKQEASGHVPVSRYIPFGVHVTPEVIKLKENGDLLATWRLHGVSFETAAPEEIAAAKRQVLNFLHAIRSSEQAEPTALWVHRVRRVECDRLDGDFGSRFAAELDRKYWDKIGGQAMLRNEIYLSVVMRPTQNIGPILKRMRTRSAEDLIEFDREALGRFESLCKQVSASLAKYGSERLGCYERPGKGGQKIVLSKLLGFYNYLVTGDFSAIPVQTSCIADYLVDARIFAGDHNGIVQVNSAEGRRYVGYLDLQDYPATTEPGVLNCLYFGDYSFTETQSFSFLSKRDGFNALELQQKRLISSGEGSPEQIRDMDTAMEDVTNGRVFMGEYHYSLAIHGANVDEVRVGMSRARVSLSEDAGFKVATVDLVPECAHFAQLPGNWAWRPRVANITTKNFASLSPFHNFHMGKRDGNPWGQAVTLLQTESGQPHYFNFHVSPLGTNNFGEKLAGNTFICGMTGAGKSVTMGFFISQLQKVPKLRTLLFDKDRGCEALIRALGGRYRQLRRGEPTGFNPFQWERSERVIKFVTGLVMDCARRDPKEVLDVKVENGIIEAVKRVFELPDLSSRRISAILQFVGEHSEIGQRLGKWCRTSTKVGSNAWVLDNARDTTNFSGCAVFGFDYTDFLADMECGPIILAYILEAADTLINGDPFVYIMEEFAKVVSSESQTLVEFARDKQTTIRKLNGLGIFVTQSPSQVNGYPIGSTIREQCVTQIYLPNPAADYKDYVEGFKLTPMEFELIRSFALDSRRFLVKQGDHSVICKLDLGGMSDELEVISGTLDNVMLLDAIRAELRSEDPEKWMPVYLERIRERKARGRVKG